MMAAGRRLCGQTSSTDLDSKLQERAALDQASIQLELHQNNTRQMRASGLLSSACANSVLAELVAKIATNKSELARVQQSIDYLSDPSKLEHEALMYVLESVALGCRGKRRRIA